MSSSGKPAARKRSARYCAMAGTCASPSCVFIAMILSRIARPSARTLAGASAWAAVMQPSTRAVIDPIIRIRIIITLSTMRNADGSLGSRGLHVLAHGLLQQPLGLGSGDPLLQPGFDRRPQRRIARHQNPL